jgi:hypothetical protein
MTGVDSIMKMVAGVGAFVFFPSYTRGDAVWPTVLGFCFICVAVSLMYLDKRRKSRKAKELALKIALETGAPVVPGLVRRLCMLACHCSSWYCFGVFSCAVSFCCW